MQKADILAHAYVRSCGISFTLQLLPKRWSVSGDTRVCPSLNRL
jgi:hypothetical protein